VVALLATQALIGTAPVAVVCAADTLALSKLEAFGAVKANRNVVIFVIVSCQAVFDQIARILFCLGLLFVIFLLLVVNKALDVLMEVLSVHVIRWIGVPSVHDKVRCRFIRLTDIQEVKKV
jgi:hypothetical protein